MFRLIAIASIIWIGQCVLAVQEQPFVRHGDRIVLFPLKKTTVSAEVDAPIKRIPLKEGAPIAKGDLLVELDNRLYMENLHRSEAAVKEAEANFAYTEKILEHSSVLLSRGGIGKQDYERAKLDMDSAAAKLSYAEANRKTSLINLESCRITAQYPGHLIRRLASEGEYVKAGQPLMDIANDLELLAVANIPSSEVVGMKAGDTAKFHIDETGAEVVGTLYESSGAVNPAGRSIEVKYLIDNRDGRLLPGMSGTIVSRKGIQTPCP